MMEISGSKFNVNVNVPIILDYTHFEMVEVISSKFNVNVNVPGDEVGQLDCTQATPRLNLAETL